MRWKILPALLVLVSPPAPAQAVPAEFVRDRIFVVASDAHGTRVRFFTDSGGGWNAISEAAQSRLKLPSSRDVELDEGRARVVDGAELFRHSDIPAPRRDEPVLRGMLVVAPAARFEEGDGTLGSRWFGGRIWDIDYGRRTLRVLPSPPTSGQLQPLAMGFAADERGQRAREFPRIAITVDGRSIDVLLDTGASAALSPGGAADLGLEPGTRIGTSFIIRSIFEAWREAHPDWRLIRKADVMEGRLFSMIEVPAVRIGTLDVGPVWFTERPDSNFVEFMSQMTDRTVSGALGGSALKYLHVVLDYPSARMLVEKASR